MFIRRHGGFSERPRESRITTDCKDVCESLTVLLIETGFTDKELGPEGEVSHDLLIQALGQVGSSAVSGSSDTLDKLSVEDSNSGLKIACRCGCPA